jgi:hypothetical protein
MSENSVVGNHHMYKVGEKIVVIDGTAEEKDLPDMAGVA